MSKIKKNNDYRKNPKYKSSTIKERTVYVYLPSQEMVDEWKEFAKKSGMSLSKFIFECVQNIINQETDFKPRKELLKELKELREENMELKKKIKMLDALVEKQEKEIMELMSKQFLEEKEGFRRYEKELVELLKNRRRVSHDDIITYLNLDLSNQELMKAINRQLENLYRYGLIEPVKGGWRWVG